MTSIGFYIAQQYYLELKQIVSLKSIITTQMFWSRVGLIAVPPSPNECARTCFNGMISRPNLSISETPTPFGSVTSRETVGGIKWSRMKWTKMNQEKLSKYVKICYFDVSVDRKVKSKTPTTGITHYAYEFLLKCFNLRQHSDVNWFQTGQ